MGPQPTAALRRNVLDGRAARLLGFCGMVIDLLWVLFSVCQVGRLQSKDP
jgi:hypothetical protein